MRRRWSAASLGALLLATVFAAQPAAAWTEVFHQGTYYDEPNIYDEPGMAGATCIFKDNPGTNSDWLSKIRIRELNSHSPFKTKSNVGFRLAIGRNIPPLGDNKFKPYYLSSEKRGKANQEEVAFYNKTWTVPNTATNRASRFRAVIHLYFYRPNGTLAGQLRARLQVYDNKLGGSSYELGVPPAAGWCDNRWIK
ncbi:MAG: hypothetical protein IT200_06890 [Thermoleophilia bacterium]|nr:hypothetical protein [Thermoleophilia bacterium]